MVLFLNKKPFRIGPVGKVDTVIKEPETLTRRQDWRNKITWAWRKENLITLSVLLSLILSLAVCLPHTPTYLWLWLWHSKSLFLLHLNETWKHAQSVVLDSCFVFVFFHRQTVGFWCTLQYCTSQHLGVYCTYSMATCYYKNKKKNKNVSGCKQWQPKISLLNLSAFSMRPFSNVYLYWRCTSGHDIGYVAPTLYLWYQFNAEV